MTKTAPNRQKLLVTGAGGFVGQALCREAAERGLDVRCAMRSCGGGRDANCFPTGAIDGRTDWATALLDIGVVIHLAARVHVMREIASDPQAEFFAVNRDGTARLARQAAEAGVRRFIYVSSIKVNGEQTLGKQYFSSADIPEPQDQYAASKWQAELALKKISEETGLQVVILRIPLVYGSGVRGNFLRLLQAVNKGIPLPLANICNARSLLYLGNLVDALLLCAVHPAAAGKTYLLRDGEDMSTPELMHALGEALGKRARLFPLPLWLLRGSMSCLGQRTSFERLTSSLRVDDTPIRNELGWKPRYTLREGLAETGSHYKR